MRIESATAADAPAIAAIYDEAARTSPATFDLEGHPAAWWEQALAEADLGAGHVTLVARDHERVAGFARAALHKVKPAYVTTAESSVYVAASHRGRGVGGALMDALIEHAERSPLLLLVAGITQPNDASVALHRARGFVYVGTFHDVGRKLGQTWDVAWYERSVA